jgi:hypothetical protein
MWLGAGICPPPTNGMLLHQTQTTTPIADTDNPDKSYRVLDLVDRLDLLHHSPRNDPGIYRMGMR